MDHRANACVFNRLQRQRLMAYMTEEEVKEGKDNNYKAAREVVREMVDEVTYMLESPFYLKEAMTVKEKKKPHT